MICSFDKRFHLIDSSREYCLTRGDSLRIAARFPLGTELGSLAFGLYERGTFGEGTEPLALANVTDFTAEKTDKHIYFKGVLRLNTEALETLIGQRTQITVVGEWEFKYSDDSGINQTYTPELIGVRIKNDYIRQDTPEPVPNPPEYVTTVYLDNELQKRVTEATGNSLGEMLETLQDLVYKATKTEGNIQEIYSETIEARDNSVTASNNAYRYADIANAASTSASMSLESMRQIEEVIRGNIRLVDTAVEDSQAAAASANAAAVKAELAEIQARQSSATASSAADSAQESATSILEISKGVLTNAQSADMSAQAAHSSATESAESATAATESAATANAKAGEAEGSALLAKTEAEAAAENALKALNNADAATAAADRAEEAAIKAAPKFKEDVELATLPPTESAWMKVRYNNSTKEWEFYGASVRGADGEGGSGGVSPEYVALQIQDHNASLSAHAEQFADKLSITDAAATYATLDGLATKLDSETAATIYATLDALAGKLDSETAALLFATKQELGNYATTAQQATAINSHNTSLSAHKEQFDNKLSITDAAATYATLTALNRKIDSATATATFATIADLLKKLDIATAADTYATLVQLATKLDIEVAADTYLGKTEIPDCLVGIVFGCLSSTPPPGAIIANGAKVSETAYARLYAKIGHDYDDPLDPPGIGRFTLPDPRSHFLRYASAGSSIDAGRTVGSLQGDAMRNIKGLFPTLPLNQASNTYTGPFTRQGALGEANVGYTVSDGWNILQSLFDASKVVPVADEFRPLNIALLPIIFY